jgi:glycosyltransferase involved in cell wall biosynthesis
MKDLSILIPTLPARIDEYFRLIKILNNQIKINNLESRVQILSICDTKDMSVGEKRNLLIKSSNGRYVCFIDDDDIVADNYLIQIFRAIESNADVITFCGEYVENNLHTPFSISRLHRGNFNEAGMLYRLPNHLCPIKREIAINCLFTDKNFGEDSDYADKINQHITNEFHIQYKLYFYLYNAQTSQTNPNNNLNAYS